LEDGLLLEGWSAVEVGFDEDVDGERVGASAVPRTVSSAEPSWWCPSDRVLGALESLRIPFWDADEGTDIVCESCAVGSLPPTTGSEWEFAVAIGKERSLEMLSEMLCRS
jgi:hypothetical protein